ncbi:MAG: NADH-quinone oxidoreductase subunit L [Nitrospinae bacterium]|nr:NADH-quinone oxidoreductase subunit L [Nitrospinota bacterium]
MLNYIYLIPLLPLIGAIVNGLFGYRIRKGWVGFWACGSTGLSFAAAVLAFLDLLSLAPEHRIFEQVLFTWISSGDFIVEAGLQVDPLSGIMMLIVTGVGFLIHVYSIGYMGHEYGYPRYFSYLNLFMFSMLVLVLGNNFLLMFIGWEGVGLCSYLLIGYYYEKQSASDAGKKAFVMNRIGDFGFALGVMLIFVTFGSIDYTTVFSEAHEKLAAGGVIVTTITLLLFLGATGKSAQIPLYTWLPDAMEGPTPVSALIHAATMVTAGVYMVARCSALFLMAPVAMNVVAIIGAVTAIFAASIGLFQNDIKRVLAYSTVSQLGYMFLACGVGAFTAAIFHVMTHAFFKACLFLGSGSVIHALHGAKDPQDMRYMGGLKNHMPRTYWTFAISTLAIAGIFPFAGFFSKDEILYETFIGGHKVLWGIAAVAAFLTAFYMFRLVFMTFHGKSRVDHEIEHHLHESPNVMTMPLVILAFLATIGGFVGLPAVMGTNIMHEFLGPVFTSHEHAGAVHHTAELDLSRNAFIWEWILMGISLAIAISGIFLARNLYIISTDIPERLASRYQSVHRLIFNKYYIDELYDAVFVNPIKNISASFLWKIFDVKIIDGIVNDTADFFMEFGQLLRRYQTGLVRNYAFSMLFGGLVIIGYYLLK